MPYLDDIAKELSAVNNFIARSDRAKYRARSVPRDRLRLVGDAAERYPLMTPAVIMSMVRGGFPDSPEKLHQLGELSAMQWLKDHPYGNIGGHTLTPGMRRAQRPGAVRMAENTTPQAGGIPIPDRNKTPEAHQAFLELQRRGLLRAGIPNEPESDNTKGPEWRAFLDAQDEFVRVNQPFLYKSRNGKHYVSEPDPNDDRGFSQRLLDERPEEDEGGGGGGGGGIYSPQIAMAGANLEGAITGKVRTAFQALDMPVQELQGQIRNIYGAAHGEKVDWLEPQSDFWISATTGMESGEGLFTDPESEVAQERRAREAERGRIGGHSVTLGRWAASALPFAPDSKPFQLVSGLVDLGVQIADPTAFALGKGARINAARKMFTAPDVEEARGLFRGPLRNVLKGTDAQKWLNSKEGTERVEWLAKTNDPYTTWLGLNRKVNLDLATELADTRTGGEVRDILTKELGTSIRETSTVSMPHLGLTDPAAQARKITDMPARGPIDAYDKDIVGAELEKWLFNGKATPEEIGHHVSAAARAENPIQLNAVIRDALRSEEGLLARSGVGLEARKKLVALHENAFQAQSQTWIDTVARQGQTDNGISLGDDGMAWDESAFLYVEHAPRVLSLPDGRNIRRATSKYKTILAKGDTGELRLPWALVDHIQNEIWKPFQLITRVAWPVRVIGEEQIRMAAAGYDSMFNHPISYIGWRLGKKGESKWMFEPKGDIDAKRVLLGESDEHTNGMAVDHGGWVERNIPIGAKRTFRKTDVLKVGDFKRAWAAEFGKLANDPVSRYVANADTLDDAKAWFNTGGGQGFKADMARAHPGKLDTFDQGDAYIEAMARRQRQAHGGNADLIDAIRTGKFGEDDILDGTKLNHKVVDKLDNYYDEFAPVEVIGDETHIARGSGPQVREAMNRATDRMFGFLMTRRTNNLSRSPVFRQAYWKEAARLMAFGDAGARSATLAAAKEANLGSRAIRKLERAASQKKVGELTLDELDDLAKGWALDQTKELLYDLTRKGRGMDAMRLVFPFGEAWREVITRWGGIKSGPDWLGTETGLLWKNPKTIRRFQQLVQGARGEELGDFLGAPDGEGFFWKNQFGEEVFAYPGTQFLTDKLLGVPIPLTGRVQGLSMFGTVVPGLGPVTQIPVGWFLQNKPGPQAFKQFLNNVMQRDLGPLGTVEEQVLPFGAPAASDPASIASFWTYAPPYIKSAAQFVTNGKINNKQWNTSVMEVAGYLKSTGEYDNSVGDTNRLMDDAAFKARGYFFVKALAGAVAPAAPDREWLVESNNGNLLRATVLADELREMQEQDYDTAGRRFLDKYGEDLYQIIGTSMTTSANYATPATKEGVAWVMENPGVEDELPNSYGFFAPEGNSEELDLSLYNADFRKGEKIRLNPPTWGRLHNDTIADLLYHEAIDQLGEKATTDAGEFALRMYRRDLHEQYPGWQNEKGELAKPDAQNVIRELYRALDNESAMNTDAGRGLRLYLEARDEVVSLAEERNNGVWPSSAEKMAPARAYLDDRAQEIMDRHPGFKKLYDIVLSQETDEE